MLNAPVRSVFDVITDFLASDPTDEALIAYRLPQPLQDRAHELLERNAEGELTFEEQQEMFDFMRADQMMSLLKAKTRLKLKMRSE